MVQEIIGHPMDTKFKHMERKKLMINLPVKVEDVTNALYIFGLELEGVQGKTARTKTDHVNMEVLQIPRDFYKLRKFVTFTAGVMVVNVMDFLTKIPRNIILFTSIHVPSGMIAQLINSQKNVKLYYQGGLIIWLI